ncbi:carboxymuconolactone decarboxylase [Nocardia mangyaensis]|uniref:Carboxymuconolactone decarboxylase n=1 Tax=Nocardia mangyaensis TaxID=2213200 RepID=A0A1J0VSI8_9NOCA|nr:carboxymuconolactone decarboxylase [Nocardia mangyaensis]APE34903.1 carboxymuconolactone decarboxylase [Nocardia mangyaensis]
MSDPVRILPLEPPYEPDVEQLLAKWMPPGTDVTPLALFRTLAIHPELATRMRPLGAGILGSRLIDPLLREVMISRTCARCSAEYEWGVHAVAFGGPLGLTAAQLRSTVHGDPHDNCWDPRQRGVLRLADELHDTSTVSDDLFAELGTLFDHRQILELTATAGWYHTIAYLIGVARVAPEPWAASFPAPTAPIAGQQ